ncbi:MAG: hypothetical protein ACI9C2_001603 [Gammaproteobacteria bacterium]|jgi:hypothetical protein
MKLPLSPALKSGKSTGLKILVVGVLIGFLVKDLILAGLDAARPIARDALAPTQLEAYLQPNTNPDAGESASESNGLETLNIQVDSAAAMTLQTVREDALNRGVIIQTDEDTVKGTVALGSASSRADIRIKGDWTDHVDTMKWSLRIKLKDSKINGMAVFSVQHPKTRGMLWEWLALAAARREGLLAPRSTFVNVNLNGNAMGIYYMEEHFSKELLESQGRREGPILLWDESTRWSSLLQAHNVGTKGITLPVPRSAGRVWGSAPAEVRAYGEGRLSSIESLSRSLYSGVEQMLAIQSLVIADTDHEQRLKRLEAIDRIQGRTIDTLLDTDKLARMHGLISLFQIEHALIWHNMRFYHDPVLDRLEPILFDCNAHEASARDIVIFRATPTTNQFAKSDAYYNGVFGALGKFSDPEYLDDLLEDLGPDLAVYEKALNDEFKLPSSFTVAGMLQRLRTEQTYLRTEIYPVDPINFHASFHVTKDEASGGISADLQVDAWATTRTPVVVDAFEFSNGVRISARGLVPDDTGPLSSTSSGGVVLPNDGRRVTFKFPMDSRLANLANVNEILAAMRLDGDAEQLDLDISAVFRPFAAEATEKELLTFRSTQPDWRESEGRPKPPTLLEALEKHSFLRYDSEADELRIVGGVHRVDGDLVAPSGYTLHGTNSTLKFSADSVLLTDSALDFENVTLKPHDGADRWRGVIVLQAKERSSWKNVTVVATDSLSRAGWTVTGGITFYRSPVTMLDCHIDGTWAEDGTNIFGADFLMERTRFTACVSDSFDGDFVTGTLRDCVFEDGLADGVDVSGSQITVVDCQFLNMGDKGISAGENSKVEVQGGLCDGVSLGIAAKDRSEVIADGMTIRDARNYALTVFVKKAEFGPAHMTATNMVMENSGLGDHLVQTDCSLLLEGETMPTQDLDVKQLYKDKILGQ